MAIVAMRHLRLIGLQSEREEMLRRLQHLGCLEITEPEPAADDPLLEKLRIPEAAELQRIREQYTAAEQALQILTDHTPKEKNALEPLPFIDEQALTDESQLADGKNAAERLNRLPRGIGFPAVTQQKSWRQRRLSSFLGRALPCRWNALPPKRC